MCPRCLEFLCELGGLRCGLGELVGLACVRTRESESCRCCGTKERSIGILHSGNPSCVEGGDVEQGCSKLETNPLCLHLPFLSFSLIFILHSIIVYLYMLDIFIRTHIDILAWV